jgi:hypothetical protein
VWESIVNSLGEVGVKLTIEERVGRFVEVAGVRNQRDRPVDGGCDGRSGFGGRGGPRSSDLGRDSGFGVVFQF